MESSQQLLGPLILFFLMVVVGLQLTIEDFRRVLTVPKVVIFGTLGQIVLLPLMTWAVLTLSGAPAIIGAGAVLLAAAPGAGLSNVLAAVSGANVALSVTLTAVTSVLAVVTIPALTAIGIRVFLGADTDVEIPVSYLVGQLVLFLLIPILGGMFVRQRRPEAAGRYVAIANRGAVIAVVVLTVISALSADSSAFPTGSDFGYAVFAGFAWTLCAMAIGWGVGALLALDPADRFTFMIEYSARNIALAFIIAVASLGRLDLGIFSAAYSMSGFPLVIAMAVWRGRRLGVARAESTTAA